ncbi:MAG: glycosyl hydrolase [Bacteroidota bacterium]
MRYLNLAAAVFISFLLSFPSLAQKKVTPAAGAEKQDSIKNVSMAGLKFRSIGPAITGGRIVDIAVNPKDNSEFFVASGHGSLWKTTNGGTSFRPAFEGQNSFAIGAVKIDPSNPNIVWVGTGENNNQSNVIYGDGVYKSEDGGSSWKNVGLEKSEHIGGIVIDPQNSNVVYVAAYGSMRNEGGDRGIFKTSDGGKTWRNVLKISPFTGCFEVHMDPQSSATVYAVAHQRMRKGYTNVSGGDESAIYRSSDSGANWQKIMKGLPTESVGRIGMTISPVNPNLLYAVVQAKEGSGVYKSLNRGATWSKESSYNTTYPFYMQKIFADPKEENKLYAMSLLVDVSLDGGKTFKPLGEKNKHVDNHVIWIDPNDTKHLLSGCDGGLYETRDMGKNWEFNANIPITEIYTVSTDNALPFYNVYIGTQDNNSLMGPSRTINSSGINNRDWTFTLGGDGFETQADWKNDNIIYAQSQNGGLFRYNKKTGEQLFIQPTNMVDTGFRFDWSSPLLMSKFDNKRLYFAANRVFRTNNQGNAWNVISDDLTRGIPPKMQKLMGRSWSIDELVSKGHTANITCLAESPLDENLLYAGTGDGLIHVTKDGGKTWIKASSLPIDEFTRVHQIAPSHFNKQVAYAACQAMTNGDYTPHLFKTIDGGRTWTSINANLPVRGSTFSITEDHIDADLLFVGTQFGLYTTVDGGKEWIKFMNGLPVTTIMDLEIQRRENDLVICTFGRGVYILDDYSPLRSLSAESIKKTANIFPVKDALMFIPANPYGFAGKGFMGANFYAAPNPEVGATFTYYVKEEPKTLKQRRREAEKERQKKGEDIEYPTYDVLNKEREQLESYLLFTVADEQGNAIRKIKAPIAKGINRITWDLRYEPFIPVSFTPYDDTYAWNQPDVGYMVTPGTYTVKLEKFEDEKFEELVAPQTFKCVSLNKDPVTPEEIKSLTAFNKKVASLTKAMNGADAFRSELAQKIPYLKQAALSATNAPADTYKKVLSIERQLTNINRKFKGDDLRGRYEGASPITLKGRVDMIAGSLWTTTEAPTETFKMSYDIAADHFQEILDALKLAAKDISELERSLDKYDAPYTPGRLPDWKKD